MDKILRLSLLDKRRKDEKYENQLAAANFITKEEAQTELNRIKKRYNIVIDKDFFNTDHQLFKSFLHMNPRAYLHFKRNSDISRTLVQNHFKPKSKTGIEKRSDGVIMTHQIEKRNERTLKRLGHELE